MKYLSVIGIGLFICVVFRVGATDGPVLWGYGNRSCDQYIQAWNGSEQGVDFQIIEHRRYEDWLSGFVTGLDLATGQDVLKGAEIPGALRRIRLHCEDHRKDDFFTATMALIRSMSTLR